jgi:putative solute:sodium symporter small subunit
MSGNENNDRHRQYWKANVKLVIILLSIWALVSLVFGILLVEQLNAVRLGGFKLGFWFAQQGSIITFVILIWVYTKRMAAMDRQYGVEEADEE